MQNYQNFKESEFFSFFGLKEKEKTKGSENTYSVILEPGGFKEHLNLELLITNSGSIQKGILELNRDWIGDKFSLNSFAKDICKSFIQCLSSYTKNSLLSDLVDGIWYISGENDRVIYKEPPIPLEHRKIETKKAISVFIGNKDFFELIIDNLKIRLENVFKNDHEILRIILMSEVIV